MRPQSAQDAECICGHVLDFQAQELFELRRHDEHSNAVGERPHHGHRDEANQQPQAQQSKAHEQQS